MRTAAGPRRMITCRAASVAGGSGLDAHTRTLSRRHDEQFEVLRFRPRRCSRSRRLTEVESRLGTLEFDDGAPSEATAALLYDHLDFHARRRSVSGCVAWRFACGAPAAAFSPWGRGQLVHVVLRADGFGVDLPDRELRHGLLLGLPRLDGRTDGDRRAVDRCTVGDPRHDRRHVVPVGHRPRSARSGPRRGRPVPHGGAGL